MSLPSEQPDLLHDLCGVEQGPAGAGGRLIGRYCSPCHPNLALQCARSSSRLSVTPCAAAGDLIIRSSCTTKVCNVNRALVVRLLAQCLNPPTCPLTVHPVCGNSPQKFGPISHFAPWAKACGNSLNFNCSLLLMPILRMWVITQSSRSACGWMRVSRCCALSRPRWTHASRPLASPPPRTQAPPHRQQRGRVLLTRAEECLPVRPPLRPPHDPVRERVSFVSPVCVSACWRKVKDPILA
jgi:hypothetical protein